MPGIAGLVNRGLINFSANERFGNREVGNILIKDL